jgi:hypothetical protein
MRAPSSAYDDLIPLVPDVIKALTTLTPGGVHWVG